jgi:hypothetical protein
MTLHIRLRKHWAEQSLILQLLMGTRFRVTCVTSWSMRQRYPLEIEDVTPA